MPILPPIRRLFPPAQNLVLHNKGQHPRRILTADGELQIQRRYFWAKGAEGIYRTALAKGWDIGSGPTEATCKTLTLRLLRGRK
jgi:hypothetical protein